MSRISSPTVMYDVRDVVAQAANRREERRHEPLEAGADAVGAQVAHVVEVGQHLRDLGVTSLVADERVEDPPQRRIVDPLLLLAKEGPREPLDPRHVGEELDNLPLVVLGHRARRRRPIEVARDPLVLLTSFEHPREIQRRPSLSTLARLARALMPRGRNRRASVPPRAEPLWTAPPACSLGTLRSPPGSSSR